MQSLFCYPVMAECFTKG